MKFADNARFMANSSSNLVDDLAEVIQKIKLEYRDCFLEYESVIENLIR